ncbi:DUF4905 domain-containing protein [Fulvivirga ligni]|uniref:DUF4905 domain-containing protein n=1 Tax=Fulvivirga ligni TaxID=2904246 RepID=UPI001F3CC8DE|nr:DUF4905 domain-containing protein [Fulvivirga ligni]UII23252.1 DUF4905 domain-containing protein [Fulvivirga ligni]
MRKLPLKFSYLSEGKIWNIISAFGSDYMLLEIRHPDELLAQYYLLDLENNEWLIEGLTFEEKWWISASYVYENVILFYTYGGKDNPDYKDFFAYDVSGKKILWTKEEVRLLQTGNNHLLLGKKGEEDPFIVDFRTGNTVAATTEEEIENIPIIQPFYYQQDSPHFHTVSKFLKSRLAIGIVKGAHYFENEQFIVVSYYYNEEETLNNKLIVLDRKGNIYLNELIGQKLPGIADDTFFVYDDKLIFVKDNSELFIYHLRIDNVN